MLSTCAASSKITREFIKGAPKIELHAHLNGCARRSTLVDIARRKQMELDFSCFDDHNMNGAFKVFEVIHKLLKELPDIRRVSREVLEDFRDQNVAYLELRTTPKSCEFGTYSKEQYVEAVLEEMEAFQMKNKQNMEARLLLSIDRGRSLQDAQSTLDILLKYQNSPLIAGLDFSGNPSKSTFKDFDAILQKAREKGVKITLHVGELDGPECLVETQDMINFRPDRFGHFNYYNESLFDQVRVKNIPIEMCPTSNFYTVNMQNMNEHHFKDFFYLGHMLNLNTDDTCVFETDSTLEHQKIIEAFNLTEQEFYQLLIRSASMIFDESLKPTLFQKIQDYFASTHFAE